jgi:hypothetical protein
MSHLFNVEYRWELGERWRLRPGMSISKAYTQTAAAEVWGDGLYDNTSKGYQMAADYSFPLVGKKATVTAMASLYSMKFPNYTDILKEFRGEDENTELAGGLKDQTFKEYALSFQRAPFRTRVRMNSLDFKREKVVQAGGTASDSKQKDSNLILSAGMDSKLWIFETSPDVSWQSHESNQNFLLFQSATDASPVFAPNYYDYTETSFNLPLFLNMTQKWALSGGMDLRRRVYADRNPRTLDNHFKGGKQKNVMMTLSGGLRKKMNDVSAMFLTYSVVTAKSNNKFERYLSSNYTGQGLSLGYQLTY